MIFVINMGIFSYLGYIKIEINLRNERRMGF